MYNYNNIYVHIQETIHTYENFLVFLQGVCISRSKSITQKLKNHGPHHYIKFLKLIGDFTGIVYRNDYNVYKNVSRKIIL